MVEQLAGNHRRKFSVISIMAMYQIRKFTDCVRNVPSICFGVGSFDWANYGKKLPIDFDFTFKKIIC